MIFGREVQVETSTEIVAKKLWHRGDRIAARDILDLALVAESEPDALAEIRPVLRDRRAVVLRRIAQTDVALREAFSELEVLEFRRTYDDCLAILRKIFEQA